MEPSERITEIIKSIVEINGAELIDIQFKGAPRNWVLKVFVDKDNGITIGECARISQDISDAMDAENLSHSILRLDVSSPGVQSDHL